MKKFLERSLEFVIIVLVFNSFMEIRAQCPSIDDILNKGWSYDEHNPHDPMSVNNGDEIGIINGETFLVKVDDYPPIRSFPIVPYSGCSSNTVWYVSFDSETGRPGPIPYIVRDPALPQGEQWIEKKHNLWTIDNYGNGYHVQVYPTGIAAHHDFLINFDGTHHALSQGNWEDHVTEPESYSTDFYVTIEGPEAIKVGSSATYIANIFGGSGVYSILWEWHVGSGSGHSAYSDPSYWFIIYGGNYYFYGDEYKLDIDMESAEVITLSVKIYDASLSDPATDEIIIRPGTNITFSNKIESIENYGKLILDEDKENPIISGEMRALAFDDESQRVIRTNELPFIVDFQTTGKTEKSSNWILENPVPNLNYSFYVNASTPAELKSNFTSTDPATIRNLLEGVAISGGHVQLNDPWYYFKDQNDNWFQWDWQSNQYKSYTSPFYIFNTTINTYGGVFLDQSGPPLWNPPFYSVKVDQEQTIPINGVNHKFYFMNWTGTDVQFEDANSNETGVVFDNANASAQAVLKGTQLSDYIYTYSQNGQRKFIRTPDGYLHTFYASMDGVWYERSTDTGQNWELIHSEYPPLDNVVFKNPSMSYYNSPVVREVLAYAVDYLDPLEPNKNDVVCIRNFVDGVTSQYAAEISTTDPLNSTYVYSNPVVACAQNGNTLVVWQTIKDGVGKKLQYAYGYWNSNGVWQLYDTGNISNSALGSYNPTLCASLTADPITFHLAWNEGNDVYYEKLTLGSFNQLVTSTKQLVSSGSGYLYNFKPSIIEFNDIPKISWIGSRYMEQQNQSTLEYKTILKHLDNNTYNRFGHHINSVSLERDEYSNYVLGWSQFDSRSSKFVTNQNNLSQIFNFGITGDYLKIGNGSDLDNMYGMIYDAGSLPYKFIQSNSINDIMNPMNKITSLSINTGREGVVYIDTAQFYFAIGDIVIDNQTIDFVEIPDSVTIDSKETLNQYFTSNSFQVTDNSSFYYTVQYGITDSLIAYNLLGENDYINFKVELIDDVTDEILGQFDDVVFNRTNLELYDNISYRVNTQGIGNRTVRLKLVTDNNFNPEYSISQMLSDEYVLGKQVINEINYKGSLKVETYDLSQNYPNPFNPSTTIKYQIPNAGNVTLKVYDILGREVTTLVDEFKNEGRYEVNFNAGKLASGVYIYTIKSNDFTASKKLMLVK